MHTIFVQNFEKLILLPHVDVGMSCGGKEVQLHLF
jgi:hypothetical protein